jgi:hypothetical protein
VTRRKPRKPTRKKRKKIHRAYSSSDEGSIYPHIR